MKKGQKKAKRKSRNWDRDRDCGGAAGGGEEVLQQGAVGPEDSTLLHSSLCRNDTETETRGSKQRADGKYRDHPDGQLTSLSNELWVGKEKPSEETSQRSGGVEEM